MIRSTGPPGACCGLRACDEGADERLRGVHCGVGHGHEGHNLGEGAAGALLLEHLGALVLAVLLRGEGALGLARQGRGLLTGREGGGEGGGSAVSEEEDKRESWRMSRESLHASLLQTLTDSGRERLSHELAQGRAPCGWRASRRGRRLQVRKRAVLSIRGRTRGIGRSRRACIRAHAKCARQRGCRAPALAGAHSAGGQVPRAPPRAGPFGTRAFGFALLIPLTLRRMLPSLVRLVVLAGCLCAVVRHLWRDFTQARLALSASYQPRARWLATCAVQRARRLFPLAVRGPFSRKMANMGPRRAPTGKSSPQQLARPLPGFVSETCCDGPAG